MISEDYAEKIFAANEILKLFAVSTQEMCVAFEKARAALNEFETTLPEGEEE